MIVSSKEVEEFMCPWTFGQPSGSDPEVFSCIGDRCMAWIWVQGEVQGDDDRGYCGLVRQQPEISTRATPAIMTRLK